MMNIDALKLPFPASRISWRVGSTTSDKSKGLALAYIDARDVMERLDQVCGPSGWQNTYPHANGKTVCSIGIKIDGEWVWKSNGAGDTDVEAEKGALSDAFKRAAVLWGIGRYLYDIPSIWVELKAAGRSYAIADHEHKKLEALLTKEGAKIAAPPAPVIDKILAMISSATDAIDLGKKTSHRATLDAIAQMNATDAAKVSTAQAAKLASFEASPFDEQKAA